MRLVASFPNSAQLEGEADLLDIDRDPSVIAHPGEHRRHGADQSDRAGAEHAVRILGALLAELAREQFADRIGIACRERVERVAVFGAAGDQHVERQYIVLAAEAAGERQHLAVELVVGLAIDQHEATGWVSALVRKLRMAVVLPAPVVPGIVPC